MNNKNNIVHLRREVLARIIQAYLSDNYEEKVDKIPFDMRPPNTEVPYRCCIHKERAILRDRAIAGLGFALEDDDEYTHLEKYAKKADERTEIEKHVLTVIGTACKGCSANRIYVTDLCQGCIARPCLSSCSFGAISIVNGKSVIDESKCKKCTKCMHVCPYKAIVKTCVPCEDVCPVSAIKKNKSGHAEINFDKCIYCGQCISACPFGAILEKSQMIDILKAIKHNKKVVAMVAPSVVGQLPCTPGQMATGLMKAGFSDVVEVAVGADLTAEHEAEDFAQRMDNKDKFMTTSCCYAYIGLIKKHIPEIEPYASGTPTPLHYTAELVRNDDKDAVTVFIGPCVAKRVEGIDDDLVDYVMSFEEMGALFVALGIELSSCEEANFQNDSTSYGRGFGISGGVVEAVKARCKNEGKEVKPVYINGLNKVTIKQLKNYAQNPETADGNLVEVMACHDGCVGGPCVINTSKMSIKEINTYKETSDKKVDKTEDETEK